MSQATTPMQSAGSSSQTNIATAETAMVVDSASPTTDENDEVWEGDSGYNDSLYETETSSVAEEVLRYREENGRTYHNFGSTEYWGPNDVDAQEQQDLRDVAERFPTTRVKGIDLSPIQPEWHPINAHFVVDDFNIPWEITSSYDLIHSRELLGSVLSWPTFFSEAFKALRPGGWMDCTEPDVNCFSEIMEPRDDDPQIVWVRLFREVSEKSGMTFEPAKELKRWMEEAGFVNVREKVVTVPVGEWPTDEKRRFLGLSNQLRLDKGMRDFTERRMRNFMGWDDDEIAALIARTRAWVNDADLHTVQHMFAYPFPSIICSPSSPSSPLIYQDTY
ncbi:hypothetical protein CJF30_00004917 [Rutstroemia sp. NJR-2017a BBW]|nr:hypothetical protein CJF30_00004917 [Rutstroemia sp. NJR-2017a BBW]